MKLRHRLDPQNSLKSPTALRSNSPQLAPPFRAATSCFVLPSAARLLSTDLRSLMRLASGQTRQRCGLHLGWKLELPKPNCISYSGHGRAAVAALSFIILNALFNSWDVCDEFSGTSFSENKRDISSNKMTNRCGNIIQKERFFLLSFSNLGLSENVSHFKGSLQLNNYLFLSISRFLFSMLWAMQLIQKCRFLLIFLHLSAGAFALSAKMRQPVI